MLAYVDSEHIGYALSGALAAAGEGDLARLPGPGTGQYDWKGFTRRPRGRLPALQRAPQGRPRLPRVLENKQAPEWAAADDNYGYGRSSASS